MLNSVVKSNNAYYADLSLHLSKRDKNKKDKSEGIKKQEKLIRSFLKNHPEITIFKMTPFENSSYTPDQKETRYLYRRHKN